VVVTPRTPAMLLAFDLPSGRWRLALDAAQPGVNVEVRSTPGGALLGRRVDAVEFDHPGGAVDLGVAPAANVAAMVRALTFTRID